MTAAERLARLGREHPEWRPWVGLLDRVVSEVSEPAWSAAVPAAPPADSQPPRPLLSGAVLHLDVSLVRRWVGRLYAAAADGTMAGRSLAGVVRRPLFDPLRLLAAAVRRDSARLEELARAADAEPAALRAVADLAALPLLHACRRQWEGVISAGWPHGYCPVCGAWPILAEARGVERARRLRCGRCGSDWATEWLRCPYCDTRNHARLGGLVGEAGAERWRVETCAVCRGYVKTVTTLIGSSGSELLLDDLASVELDLAALAAGYSRPAGAGYPPDVDLVAHEPVRARRFLAWRA